MNVYLQLEQRHAYETAKLNPPHRFVPWVVVNNQPLEEVSLQIASMIYVSFGFESQTMLICVYTGFLECCELCMQSLQRQSGTKSLQISFTEGKSGEEFGF